MDSVQVPLTSVNLVEEKKTELLQKSQIVDEKLKTGFYDRDSKNKGQPAHSYAKITNFLFIAHFNWILMTHDVIFLNVTYAKPCILRLLPNLFQHFTRATDLDPEALTQTSTLDLRSKIVWIL